MNYPDQLLEATKKALLRLNPRRLAGGDYVHMGGDGKLACCASGAVIIAAVRKDKVRAEEFEDVIFKSPDCTGCWPAGLVHVNDKFRRGDNSVEAQEARWKHVYEWVNKKLGAR